MRRRFGLVVALLVLMNLMAGVVASRGVGITTARAQEISCEDFNTPEAAQALLDADDSFEDVLDPDGDGDACTEDDLAEIEAQQEAAASGVIAELEARFGSPREVFEAEYGEPTEETAEAYPFGFEYDVDGFRDVSVFYHSDYVAYLTLTSERRSPFSMDEAEEVAFDFLPEDFEQGDQPEETSEGDLLIPGHSDALEDRFGAGTYLRYGATGEPGDVYFLLRLDADSDVHAVEIGLGVTEQEPQEDTEEEETPEPEEEEEETPEPDEGDDAAEYVETVTTEVTTLLQSIDEFYVVIQDPDFGNDETIDQLTATLLQWSGAFSTAEELTPPDGYEEAHELYLEFTELLLGASTDFLVGIGDGDDTSIQSAGEQLTQAQETGQALLDLLEEL